MVKCTCGRQFKNIGKLHRHIMINDGDGFNHKPDVKDERTAKEAKNYYHKRRKANGNDGN